MANETASLVIVVDSTGVAAATAQLDAMAAAGARAEAATGALGSSSAASALSGVTAALGDAGAAMAAVGSASADAGAKVAASTKAMGESAAEATARIKAMVAASLEQAASNEGIAESETSLAERAGARIELTAEQIAATQAAIAAQDAQMVSMDAYTGATEAATVATEASTAAVVENAAAFTLNSRATAEASTIISEVATDQFGRMRRSVAALANSSGLISKIFTPMGLSIAGATAALGLGVLAFEKGSAEAENFSKALILTGNTAGTTSQQLATMASNVAAATGGTVHSAAAAIAQISETGKFTASQIQLVAESAKQLQDATGQAVKETIKQFESLGNDPASAVVKLNDAQHFLTLSVYDQIKALQDQGQEQAATDLAMRTYAETIAERTPKITENLGLIQRAWEGIKGAAAAAIDTAMSVGRAQTDQQKFDTLASNRDAAKSLIDRGMGSDYFLGTTAQKYFDNATAQLVQMQDDFKRKAVAASAQANQQAAQDAGIKLAREADVYASAEVRRARLIAKAHGDANDAIAKAEKVQDADLRLKLIAQAKANEEALIAGIESKGPKLHVARQKSDPFAGLNNLVQSAQVFDQGIGGAAAQTQQVTKILVLADAGAKLIQSGHDVAQVQAEVAKGVAALNEGYAKQADLLLQRNTEALKTYQSAIDQQIADKQKRIDLQVASIGMGAQEAKQQQELATIYAQVDRTIEQLNRARSQKGADVGYIDGEIAAQKASIPILVAQDKAKFAAMAAAQGNWLNGASTAFQNYLDQASNVAGQTDQLFTNAFNGMGNALANFVTTGKLNFTSLATSILADLARMEVFILESKALKSIMGLFLGGGSAMATSFDSNGTFFSPYANGGVFQNSPSLSAYSGSVVSSPTPFLFASGAGIMGEAGPEAILPLRRGADGKLGVAAGGGGSAAPVVNINVAVDNSGNATSQSSGDTSALASQFAERMKAMSRQTIADEQRPGGLLWRMAHP